MTAIAALPTLAEKAWLSLEGRKRKWPMHVSSVSYVAERDVGGFEHGSNSDANSLRRNIPNC